MFFRLSPLEQIQKKETVDEYIVPGFNPAAYSQWEVQRQRMTETPERVRQYLPFGEVLVNDYDIETKQTTKRKMPIHGPVYMGTVVQDNIGEDWKYDLSQPQLEQKLRDQELYVDSQTLINIKFIKVLGTGAFGTVYEVKAEEKPEESEEEEAKTLSPNKIKEYKLACKVVRPQIGTVEGVEQALTEMRILRYLRHENICNFKDIAGIKDRETGFQYAIICMFFELCDGDLQILRLQNQPKKLIEDRVLSEQLSRHWFKQIVRGVEYIHSNGIVHRDLKEQNILFRYGNYFGNDYEKTFLLSIFKLTDFGISREDQSEQHQDISSLLNILFITTIAGPKCNWQQFYSKCQTGNWTEYDPKEWSEVSLELKDLMGRMARDRNKITASQILEHNWVNIEKEIPFEEEFIQEFPEMPENPKAFSFDTFELEFPPFGYDWETGNSQMSSNYSRSSSFGSIPELIKDFDLETHPWFYDILQVSDKQPKIINRWRSLNQG